MDYSKYILMVIYLVRGSFLSLNLANMNLLSQILLATRQTACTCYSIVQVDFLSSHMSPISTTLRSKTLTDPNGTSILTIDLKPSRSVNLALCHIAATSRFRDGRPLFASHNLFVFIGLFTKATILRTSTHPQHLHHAIPLPSKADHLGASGVAVLLPSRPRNGF